MNFVFRSSKLGSRVYSQVSPSLQVRLQQQQQQRLLSSFQLKDSYENILVERKENAIAGNTNPGNGIGLITLNRPKALNALSDGLFTDLIHAAKSFDQDDTIDCLVLTGSTKAFAAGADISEMKDRTFDYAYQKVCGV